VNNECAEIPRDMLSDTKAKHGVFLKGIFNEIKNELSQFGYADSEIADILVKLLYHVKPSSHKSVLWFAYGDYILENIKKHKNATTKVIQCVDCGEWFETSVFDSSRDRCEECYEIYRREYKALKEKERRKRLRGQTL
jgi:hypothetical protein